MNQVILSKKLKQLLMFYDENLVKSEQSIYRANGYKIWESTL